MVRFFNSKQKPVFTRTFLLNLCILYADDLPVIKENIRRTFLETQSKVNKWVADLKKKIDGEDPAPDESPTQGYGPARSGFGAQRRGDVGRRSGELDRYDADPHVLGDDLAGLELRDDDEGKGFVTSGFIIL